jgi:hypothetical protein
VVNATTNIGDKEEELLRQHTCFKIPFNIKDIDTTYFSKALEECTVDDPKLQSLVEDLKKYYKLLDIPLLASKLNHEGTKNAIADIKTHKKNYKTGKHTKIPSKNENHIKEYDRNFVRQLFEFEDTMFNLHPKHCKICRQRRLNLVMRNGICVRCNNEKGGNKFTHKNNALPTWVDADTQKVHYDIPKQLQHLTIAEKLLIQRVSPLVPVIHVKNGCMASRGHVVSFFQDISGLCTVFPKLPSHVTMVKVMRTSVNKEGDTIDRIFLVNRKRVLNALVWLKKHNHLYRDITIDEKNLDWMNGKKQCNISNLINIESSEVEEVDKDRYVYYDSGILQEFGNFPF